MPQVNEMTTQAITYLIIHIQKNSKLIVILLSKQQVLNADPNAIQEIRLIGNLERTENTTVFFIIKDVKLTYIRFDSIISIISVPYELYLALI